MSLPESSSPVGPPRYPIAYWPGMLLAPILFLAYQSIAYALVPYACESRNHAVLHLVSAFAVALLVATLALSVRDWRRDASSPPYRHEVVSTRRRFLAHLALGGSAFTLLAALALWFTQFVVPPCVG